MTHDHAALFDMGAHPFLNLTLWIAMFERDHTEPLAMQLDYAAKLAHATQPYPDISHVTGTAHLGGRTASNTEDDQR